MAHPHTKIGEEPPSPRKCIENLENCFVINLQYTASHTCGDSEFILSPGHHTSQLQPLIIQLSVFTQICHRATFSLTSPIQSMNDQFVKKQVYPMTCFCLRGLGCRKMSNVFPRSQLSLRSLRDIRHLRVLRCLRSHRCLRGLRCLMHLRGLICFKSNRSQR